MQPRYGLLSREELAAQQAAENQHGQMVSALSAAMDRNKPSPVNLHLNGVIDSLDVRTANIAGMAELVQIAQHLAATVVELEQAVTYLADSNQRFTASLAAMETTLKTLKLPTPQVQVHVPKLEQPHVTVQPPVVHVPAPIIALPKAEPGETASPLPVPQTLPESKRLVEVLRTKDSYGAIQSITEVYDDGTKRVLTGMGTAHMKVSYE